MRLGEKIQSDLVVAMKGQDQARTAVLRLLKSALKNEQIKAQRELSADDELKVLQREAKQRRDSIEAYKQGDRLDLADLEQAELDLITQYLPQPLSEAELKVVIDQVIAKTGAQGLSQMGQVIGQVMSMVSGKADGGVVSQLVRSRLSS